MNNDFRSINQPFSNEIVINGESYLYFGGTAYLGIPQNQDFINLYIEGIKKFGLNNGTSRSNNIQLGIYADAEQVAAKRFLAEDALITSSGYLAAQLTVKGLAPFGEVIYAPATHPALWLSEEPFSTTSFTGWKRETIETINTSGLKNWVLISNSMNNLFPEIYDFSFLNEIDHDKKITLIIDDSHGIGINNNGLSALISFPQKSNIEVVVVASMAKALGVDAGLVLGSKKIISQLKNTNMFVGASPSAAAGLFAFIHGEQIYGNARRKLLSNMEMFSENLSSDWKFVPGFPAFLINDPKIDQYLLRNRVLISSFPYPTKNSDPINRIILSSWHQHEDIARLISLLD
ncbi:aminotransferase class I/II-fold pyridoxal phosphate-dependent enzyme [Pedobacter chinensis]|uniref:Aminotransferase class I/II-fold pyridoxal phosphate-dependent enzyme n=1 Tax=Pedobacter chinensis TaxID=2282421 RepID=A0A369Q3K2_9SPHI|nr:aminotransferase class I/II-fold pyridoxal phosphate-dependent enzyme [Pedobacter chinensis]RDC56908.1 aminotransferase class I/II-fold pyridoxal phosphate-dependent enzyme [Pedobacter chinensis]